MRVRLRSRHHDLVDGIASAMARPAMTDSGPVAHYVLDNSKPEASGRFDALASLSSTPEPSVISKPLARSRTGDAWKLPRAGARSRDGSPAGSVQVGASSLPISTFGIFEDLSLPNLEIVQHNILDDASPEPAFDLVHTRLLLVHLPRREEALDRMISALKPGGWLLAEEFDSVSTRADRELNPAETLLKSSLAGWAVMEAAGVEIGYGRKLAARLKAPRTCRSRRRGQHSPLARRLPVQPAHQGELESTAPSDGGPGVGNRGRTGVRPGPPG